MRERKVVSLTALLAFLLSTNITRAQLPTATVLGVVRDSSGAVVPSARLTAVNVETGQSRTATTAADGSYRFSALTVGTYEIRAEESGFQTAIRTGLTLTVSQEAVVNFTLQVGAIEQTVAVMAEAPLVNTTSGSLGGLVNEAKVAELPLNGRNYVDLTLLQTGVAQHVNRSPTTTLLVGMLFSSNGATLRSNNFLLDGAIMQSYTGVAAASTSGSTLGVEGIREYRLITSAFSAEYGLTAGSQMMIVSKNGTNTFHGSAFEFFRNSALDARNFFDYKTATRTRRLPPYVRNNLGGSFGGPIKRDRTFFYGV
ncbi:MAG: carboxypeptidase regulatory-like domain-containing protein [Acidobacteria bacterium]|nr:carboxypeptidase regulatory-like domain-containing protein [Acidobacteriota bacterium]